MTFAPIDTSETKVPHMRESYKNSSRLVLTGATGVQGVCPNTQGPGLASEQTVQAAREEPHDEESKCRPQVSEKVSTSEPLSLSVSLSSSSGAPVKEIPTNGPGSGPFDATSVATAVESLAARPQRDSNGRFLPANTAAATTLSRSKGLETALQAARRTIVHQVKQDSGIEGDNAAITRLRLMDAYAQTSLLRESIGVRMFDSGGAITAKGRQRALFAAYLQALDREMRLAQLLGLERRAKTLNGTSMTDYLSGES